VALLWGGNLGTVYPFIEVVLHNKTLHQWAGDRIRESEGAIAAAEQQIAAAERRASPGKSSHSKQIATLRANIAEQQSRIEQTKRFVPWIEKYAPRDPFRTLLSIVSFMFIATAIRGIFLAANMYLVARVGLRTVLDLQNQVFQNVLDMEISEVGVKGTGDLINRIRGETGAIGSAITTLFGKTIREPMKMAACLIGAACVNWRLLVLSLLVSPLACAIMVALARKTKRASRRAMEDSARLLDRLYQALTYLRIVRCYNMQQHELNRFKQVAKNVYRKAMRISAYDAMARTNNELLSVTVIGLSVLAGGYLVLNQQTHLFGIRMSSAPMDFGQVMLFFAFLIGAVDPLRKLGDVYNHLQGGIVAAERVFPIIDKFPAVQQAADAVPVGQRPPAIEFQNVGFAYEFDKRVVDDVSFEIPAGTSLAIIGPNGCGKSTLINLLARFFDPQSGGVLINGTDLRQIDLKEFRGCIGFVTQMTMLFGDSIAANIAYGMPEASEAEIMSAAEKAHAHEFISCLSAGYQTNIGEHGGKLSGGQRQRLSLARAILKDPSLLILDEATSQIDPESEVLIHKTLREFIKGRTTLIVTHRLSTLDLVDRILVMNQGRIVDWGTHQELLSRCAIYRRLRNSSLEEAA
jgi:ATP-binding cassette subfamily B protein/subfamily B ATP-binding cassette protein MsbA